LAGHTLDDGTVHHRVGVGHADLDDVRTGLDERDHGLDGAVDGGLADGQVADEAGAVLGAAAPEDLGEPAPGLVGGAAQLALPSSSTRPNQAAAVCMSLSPRPERLTSSSASGPSSRPTSRVAASACADSSAGMMPSVRHSSSKACITCSSVAYRHSARPLSRRCACSGPTLGKSSPADD